jgi:hypothetical protein
MSKETKKFSRNFFVGLLFFLLAVVCSLETLKLPFKTAVSPITSISVIALMGIILMIKSFSEVPQKAAGSVFNLDSASKGGRSF